MSPGRDVQPRVRACRSRSANTDPGPMFRFFAPLLVVLLVTAPAVAAPKAELWPRWQQHDPTATQVVDHLRWARFLASYLRPGADGVNRVAYAEVDPAGRAGLGAYLA